MNNYCISDIHGNAERFALLVSALNLKHPNKDYKLHILGDLFDRGDDSEEILTIIYNNYENINVLKGNHEALFMAFMEDPTNNYINWQMNYSYSTIMSFGYKHLSMLADKYADFTEFQIMNEYYKKLVQVERRLKCLTGTSYRANRFLNTYVNQIKTTVSSRDVRNAGADFRQSITSSFRKKKAGFLNAFEKLFYAYLIDDFCGVYEYFDSLDKCALVGDDYLLVHSGFVSRNKNPNVKDSCGGYLYNECETIEDLIFQNEYPMIWSRRYEQSTGKPVAPDRFDGRVVVFGHTTTNSFNENKSTQTAFNYDKQGRLASVGIDGGNYNKFQGLLNCVCLEDLSQMVVKGCAQKGTLAIENIPYVAPSQLHQPTQPTEVNF